MALLHAIKGMVRQNKLSMPLYFLCSLLLRYQETDASSTILASCCNLPVQLNDGAWELHLHSLLIASSPVVLCLAAALQRGPHTGSQLWHSLACTETQYWDDAFTSQSLGKKKGCESKGSNIYSIPESRHAIMCIDMYETSHIHQSAWSCILRPLSCQCKRLFFYKHSKCSTLQYKLWNENMRKYLETLQSWGNTHFVEVGNREANQSKEKTDNLMTASHQRPHTPQVGEVGLACGDEVPLRFCTQINCTFDLK